MLMARRFSWAKKIAVVVAMILRLCRAREVAMRKSMLMLVGIVFLAGSAFAQTPESPELSIGVFGSGTTDPQGGTMEEPRKYTYPPNTLVTVTATPDPGPGHVLLAWILDGEIILPTGNSINVTMYTDRFLMAYFSSHLATLEVQGNGTAVLWDPESQEPAIPPLGPAPGQYNMFEGQGGEMVATPGTGSFFDHWEINGQFVATNPLPITFTDDVTIRAVFSVGTAVNLTVENSLGQGTVTPGPGVYNYAQGSTATITAAPNGQHVLHHWIVDGNDVPPNPANPNVLEVLMDANHTVRAVFTVYLVTFVINGQGSLAIGTTPQPEGVVPVLAGAPLFVNATPAAGWSFARWTVNGANAGTNPSLNTNITRDTTIQATFTFSASKNLTITKTGRGTTDPAPGAYTHSTNSVVPITATPDQGYSLIKWVVDGIIQYGAGDTINITMDADHTVNAVFSSFRLDLSAVGEGGIERNGFFIDTLPILFQSEANENVSLRAIAQAGSAFSHWVVNGVNAGSANPLQITMDKDYTITAVFLAASQRALTLIAEGQGSTDPAPGSYTYEQGSIAVIQAYPAFGTPHQLHHWELDGVTVPGAPTSLNVTMDSDHIVRAVFTSYLVTIAIEGQGLVLIDGSLAMNGAILPFVAGSSHTAQATPAQDWIFSHWLFNGINLGSQTPVTTPVIMSGVLTAVFSQAATILGVVTFNGNPLAGVVMNGLPGSPQTNALGQYTASIPIGWSGTVQPSLYGYLFDPPSVQYENVLAVQVQNYTASRAQTFPLSVTVKPVGTGTVELDPPTSPYPAGTTVTLTPQAAVGYDFDHWEGDLTGNAMPATITMTAARSVVAVFVEEPCVLQEINALNLADGAVLHVANASLDMPLTLAALTDCPDDTASVSFTLDDETPLVANVGNAGGLFSVAGPALGAIQPGAHTLTVRATSRTRPSAVIPAVAVAFSVVREAAAVDADGNGLPDHSFTTLASNGAAWLASILVDDTGAKRLTSMVRWTGETGKAAGTHAIVALSDAANPAIRASVIAPAGLLHSGETGILLLQSAPDTVTLLGAIESSIAGSEPAASIANGAYVQASIMVSGDGGLHYAPISPARLAANPVHVAIEGANVAAAVSPALYSYPTSVVADPVVGDRVIAWTGEWNQDHLVKTFRTASSLEADVSGLSVLAPLDEGLDAPVIAVTLPSEGQSYSFGVVGTGRSLDAVFKVRNTGGGILAGKATASAPFEIVSGATYRLSAGQSQDVTVRFSPAAGVTYTSLVAFSGAGGFGVVVNGTGYTVSVPDTSCVAAVGAMTAPPPPPGGDGILLVLCAAVLLIGGRRFAPRRQHP